jgi:hypothetical protein
MDKNIQFSNGKSKMADKTLLNLQKCLTLKVVVVYVNIIVAVVTWPNANEKRQIFAICSAGT